MKILVGVFLFISIVGYSQVSIGKLEPNDSAQLEIVSNNKGLLIPKITLTSLTDVTTITSGNIDGLTVFNTSTTSDLKPGYYYWHGNVWNRLITKEDIIGGNDTTNTTLSQDGTYLILTDSEGGIVKISLADINTTNSSLAKSTDGLSLELTDSNNNKVSIALSDISSADLKIHSNNNHLTSDAGINGDGTSLGIGTDNIAIGKSSMLYVTQANNNVAIGTNTLEGGEPEGPNVFMGNDNVAIGHSALRKNVSGNENIAIGSNSIHGEFYSNVDRNVAIGYEAFYSENTGLSGNNNVSIGYKSLYSSENLNGNNNVSIGYKSLYSSGKLNGDNNISIGYESSLNIGVNDSNNITIGYRAGVFRNNGENSDTAVNNQLNIGNIIFGIGVDGVETTLSTGNIGIGVANPTSKLQVDGTLTLGEDGKSTLGSIILHDSDISTNNTITINSSSTLASSYSLTLPADDGDATQVLATDGSGVLYWTEDKGGVFTKNGTVITNITDITDATDTSMDFVFGSTQLDDDTSTTEDNNRMFFDKSKGAFRVGTTSGDQWDDANIGIGSIAMGNETKAIGVYSIAMGVGTEASGFNSMSTGVSTKANGSSSTAMGNSTEANGTSSTSMGNGTKANGTSSTSMGNGTIANGYFSTAMGYSTTAPSYGETTIGFFNTGYTLSDTDNSGDGYDSTNKLYSTDRL
ncbi:MAG: hypothetical protein HRT66_13495, partial [Flavobacteriaceae bacterium]|nr:hypothetical protein [Flavobacteriaceae bacterium]